MILVFIGESETHLICKQLQKDLDNLMKWEKEW